MHFLLWTKGSHENTNFDTFKCSSENLLNSSCHFPKHKSVFLQICMILQCHKIQLLCTFLGETLYTLFKRDQSKCKFFRLLVLRSKFTKFLSFLKSFSSNFAPLFGIMRHISPILIFSCNFIILLAKVYSRMY